MASKYFLEICFPGTIYSEADFQKLPLKNVELKFKVKGESRMIAVVTGDVDEELEHIKKHIGSQKVDLCCTPIIPYETFAADSLEVKDSDYEKKSEPLEFSSDPDKETYWVNFRVGYEGRTISELKEAWHAEAVAALKFVFGGEVPVKLYKNIYMRQGHFFTQMPGAKVDTFSFTLPMLKAMGDQVNVITRRVKPL